MEVSVIRNVDEFIRLESAWNLIVQDCKLSIFSSFDWLSIWWKHFGKNRKLIILTAKEKDKIIGIAPLMYSVYSRLGSIGAIEFIGTPHSDYNDFLILEKREEVLEAFCEYLKNLPERWSYIKLTNIPESSPNLGAIKKLFKNCKPICKSPFMKLPDSYDQFFSSLGHNLRHNLRKNQKELSARFKMDFVDCSSAELCSFGMCSLFELHQKRWLHKGYSGLLASNEVKSFHMELAQVFAKKNQLILLLLKLSDVPVAVSYGFKHDAKFYFYLQGLDPENKYFKYAVGNQIVACTVKKCISCSISEFDFLNGGEAYKKRWGATSRINSEVLIFRNSLANFRYSSFEEYQKFYFFIANLSDDKYLKQFLRSLQHSFSKIRLKFFDFV